MGRTRLLSTGASSRSKQKVMTRLRDHSPRHSHCIPKHKSPIACPKNAGRCPKKCKSNHPSTLNLTSQTGDQWAPDAWRSRASKRKESGHEKVLVHFRFVRVESVVRDPRAGPLPRRGCPTVALAQDLSVRLVPARAALHARPWPEMAREAQARRQVLKVANVPHPGRF
jgi:hypothetical protein